jgi:hypothetical protein
MRQVDPQRLRSSKGCTFAVPRYRFHDYLATGGKVKRDSMNKQKLTAAIFLSFVMTSVFAKDALAGEAYY